MASLNLTQEELKAVEQTRQRLFHLSNSILSLKQDVYTSSPLPSLESLQTSADILQQNMRSLLGVMTQHNDLFTRLAVHPSTNYPGRTQPNILLQLLRKKPEPDVAAAMDEGRRTYDGAAADNHNGDGDHDPAVVDVGDLAALTAAAARRNADGADADDEDDEPLPMNRRWEAIDGWIGRRAQRFIEEEFPEDFTAEELDLGIDHVRTGLRRKFDEYEEEDEDEEDGEDQPAKKAEDKSAGPPKADVEEDIIMLDRPPPPPPAIPSLQSQASRGEAAPEHVEGLTLENMLRVATVGSLPKRM